MRERRRVVSRDRLTVAMSSPLDSEYCMRILGAIDRGDCEGCGGCCGRVLPMTAPERARLVEYVGRHKVAPVSAKDGMCALLDQRGRCLAYPARPFVCRAWCSPSQADVVGTRPGQPCGMRASMATRFWSRMGEYESTDTWELFGIVKERT